MLIHESLHLVLEFQDDAFRRLLANAGRFRQDVRFLVPYSKTKILWRDVRQDAERRLGTDACDGDEHLE